MKNRDMKKYMRQVELHLNCPESFSDSILKEFSSFVSDYVTEHPEATLSDMQNDLGTPDRVAEIYLSDLPQDKINQYRIHKRHRRQLGAFILIAILLTILAGCIVLLFQQDYLVYEVPVLETVEGV